MKKATILIVAMLLAAMPLKAQQVNEDNFSRLRVSYQTERLKTTDVTIDGTTYSTFAADGFITGGEVGTPALPQLSSLIEVPVCKGFTVKVENAVYDTITLAHPAVPMQPSRSKSDTSAFRMTIDREAYATDAYFGEVAQVEYIGVARDRHIARLVFSPVRVNPVQGKAIVCRSAEVIVEYTAADEAATLDLFQRYYTPAYSIGATLNSLLSPKYVSNATPIRMAVLAHSSLRCKKLEEFLLWKRQQGFRVDVYYIDETYNMSTSAVASMLAGLYTNASETNPAPAYLLIVGDVAQVPAHSSRLSGWYEHDHITDLYYTTWSSGDKVPDCYHGRFSATDTNTLGRIINKTMLYEQYNFPDDSYLARAALIAGVDQSWSTNTSDNAYTYADPAMDYIASFYVNHANGYDTVTYFKNRTNYAPNNIPVTGSSRDNSTASILKEFYNEGVGWVNYSAHGDWNEWSIPEFSVNDVNRMSNNDKPAFMIGSCCLSNKFDKPACLGEALLRKGDKAGAIGYIGGSNYTYWGEDFYWAVGARSNVSGTMTPTYNANYMGSYDYLFHTHNEALSKRASTAGKMMFYGNIAVQNAGSSLSDYYWEIYHLMGDPTLMPWLGRAENTYVAVNDAGTTVYIGTHAGAYVAVVNPADSMRVVSAAFADANGNATLTVPANHATYMLSVTAQGHKPYHYTFNNLGISNPIAVNAEVYPNPATDGCTILCNGMQNIRIVNSLGQTVRTVSASGDRTELDLQGLSSGVYILRIATTNGVATKKLLLY